MHTKNKSRISDQRKSFFDVLAKYWEEYGLPGLSGYIDALLWLEQRDDWTQVTISKRLKELFGDKSEYPTSIASVNRAIKINVHFGTLFRKGTHKLGYSYHVADDTSMLEMMFQRFIDMNEMMMDTLSDLQSSDVENSDPELFNAVQMQNLGIQIYNESLEHGFQYLKKKIQGD
jgi:hypothetical protein